MPPILQPVMRVFEPMMYIFNFLLELKPSLQPPLQPPPQLVQPLRPVTLKERAEVVIHEGVKLETPPLPEEVTSPRAGSGSTVFDDARYRTWSALFPFFRRYRLFSPPVIPPPSLLESDMAPPRPTVTTNPSSSSRVPKSEYISTDTGNKVARRSQLHGTPHIILGGRAVIQPQVCIRGDLTRLVHPTTSSTAPINTNTTTETQSQPQPQSQAQPTVSVSIGRYSFISTSAVLRPPSKLSRGILSYHALRVGEHVLVGPGAVVEAAAVGDRVVIGEGSVVGRFAILKEGCVVLPGAVVPGGMVVPSGAVVGGRPARLVGEVGDGWEGEDLREMWRGVG